MVLGDRRLVPRPWISGLLNLKPMRAVKWGCLDLDMVGDYEVFLGRRPSSGLERTRECGHLADPLPSAHAIDSPARSQRRPFDQ